MQQHEFEERTRIKVTANEYETIEAIYMATGDNVDKDEFCQLYMTKEGRATLLRLVTDEKNITDKAYKMACDDVEELKESIGNGKRDIASFLLEQSGIYNSVALLKKAVELVGHAEVVKMKLERGLKLMQMDKDYIVENLK